jgi:hypothetical protein
MSNICEYTKVQPSDFREFFGHDPSLIIGGPVSSVQSDGTINIDTLSRDNGAVEGMTWCHVSVVQCRDLTPPPLRIMIERESAAGGGGGGRGVASCCYGETDRHFQGLVDSEAQYGPDSGKDVLEVG